MQNRQSSLLLSVLVPLFILSVFGMLWIEGRFPFSQPGGDHFLPRWLGTRLYLINGQSPYSQATVRATQRMVYGHQARAGEDPQFFLYPFFSVVFYAPWAVISNYSIARSIWMGVLLLALYGTVILGLLLTNWRVSGWLLVSFLVFSVLWFPAIRTVISGNIAVLVSLLLMASFLAIRANHDGLASLCLAAACVKPNLVVLLVLLVLIWAASNRRWVLVGGFLGSLGLVVAATSLFMPGWLLENLKQLVAFVPLVNVGTPGKLFITRLPGVGLQMGWILTVVMAGLLLWEWWNALGKDFQWLFWTACLTLAAASLIGIPTSTDNYVMIYPAVVLMLATWQERWGKVGLGMMIVSLLLLTFGLHGLWLRNAWRGIGSDMDPFYFFFLPVFTIFGLYWVRWWAIHPSKLLLENLAEVMP